MRFGLFRIWGFDIEILCGIQCISYSMTIPLEPGIFDSLRLELRRGCLIVAVLAQLRVEHYGYTLRKALADEGLAIEESTLYPLLRRLETQGLLTSQWREEDKRKKRFYRLSPEGAAVLEQLLVEWNGINESLHRILKDKD
jgi:PadR family transcriptional regulator PadR